MITVFPVRRRMTRASGTSDVPRRKGRRKDPTGIGTTAVGLLIRHGRTTAGIVVRIRLVLSIGPVTNMNVDAVWNPRKQNSRTATFADRIALGINARTAPRLYVKNVMSKVQNACATSLRSVTVTIDSRL